MTASPLPSTRRMSRSLRRQGTRCVVMWCLAWCAATGANAAPTAADAPADQSPIAYRRVFVPADHVEAWPRDGEKYLPVETRDFDAWVAAASAEPAAAEIDEAEFSARLEGDRLVGGRGQWRIVRRGQGEAWLSLDEMAIVVRSATWRDDPAAARLGVWQRGDGSLAYGLQVPGDGTLQFDWHSIRSHRSQSTIEIPLGLPPAARKRLVLDLPAGKRPVVDGAVVLDTTDVPPPAATDATTDDATPSSWRRWRLALGATTTTQLRVEDEQARSVATAPTATARRQHRYHTTQRGLDVSATVHLDGLPAELMELELELPRGLQLTGATAAGRALAWRTLGTAQGETTRALVRLDAPADSGRLVLELTGWAPLVAERSWRLPKIRVLGTYWTTGTMDVMVDSTLEVRAVTPIDCIQTAVGQADEEAGAATLLSFDEYLPTAGVELVIGDRPAVTTALVGTALHVGEVDVAGTSTCRFTVDEGHVFALAADVAPGWTIEAVESAPAEPLGQWYVDRHDDGQTVSVQLARPVRPGRPITLAVTGRLQRVGILEPLPAETLRLVEWHDVRLAGELLSIRAGEPYDVEPIGRLPAVAPDQLSDDEQVLLATAAGGQVFDLLAAGPGAAARLTPRHGAFDASVQLEATLDRGQLHQMYRITCRPHTSGIDQLVVRASRPLPAETEWADPSSGLRLQAEPLPTSGQDEDADPADGRLWRVRLPRPVSGQTMLTARFTAPCSTRCGVPLLSLPEAAQQQGRVRVCSDDGVPCVDQRGLVPMPVPTSEGVDAATVWALYSYDPRHIGRSGHDPALWVRAAAAGSAPAGLIARGVLIESFYTPSTTAAHRVTYQLDNPGADEFALRLPAGGLLESVWLDGRPGAPLADADASGTIVVRLPAGEREPSVTVCFRTNMRPLAAGRRLAAPLPHSDVPLLAGEWAVWLPEDFAAVGRDVRPTAGRFDWRARLFGTWAAVDGQAAENDAQTVAAEAPLVGNLDTAIPVAGGSRRGWKAWRVSFVAGPPATVVVLHPPATTAWALSLFLACVVGGVWLRCRSRCFIVLAALLAGLCLLLPAAYAPLATGAWLGLMASLVVGVWRRPDVEDSPTVSMSQATVVGAVVLAVMLAANRAVADDASVTPDATSSSAELPTYRVLVPIDEDGQVVGTKQYVSDELLRRLLPRTVAERSAGHCLLGDATIQGELVRGADQAEVEPGTWTMAFDVEVLVRDAEVWLPLARSEARWHADAMLDGVATPLEWDADGQRARIRMTEPGRYRLVVSLAPMAHDDGEACRLLALSVPPLRGARFELSHPNSLSDCEVVGAVVAPSADAATGKIMGELDGSGRLTVCWPNEPDQAAADQGLRTTELRWLRITPSGAELDVKYVLEGDAVRPDALSLVADRRWELLGGAPAGPAATADTSRNGGQTIRVAVPAVGEPGQQHESAARSDVLLRFRLRGEMHLGRLRLPALRLTSLAVDQRLLAVTADPSLECEAPAGEAVTTGSSQAFLELWGAGVPEAPPQLVVAGMASDESWTLAVRPNVAESTVDQVLHVAAGPSALRVQYQADVVPSGAERFGLSLSVPAELAIDGVTVDEAGHDVPLRVARLDGRRVNVFFTRATAEPYRLVLSGRLPLNGADRRPMPHVVWAARPTAAVRTLLYRDESVLVSARGESLAAVRDRVADLLPVAWNARHLETYRLSAQAAAATELLIRPNDVATDGYTVTSLSYEGGAWRATLAIHGHVTGGQLGVVRVDAPTSWRGPLEVQPASATSTTTARGTDGRQTVRIRLPEPLAEGQALDLTISGPLAAAGPSAVEVPDVRMVGGDGWTHYVVVPATIDSHRAAWTTDGLVPAHLPNSAQPAQEESSPHVFRVVERPARAELAPQLTPQPTANVPLVETAALAGVGGGQYAVTRMVVVPQGLRQCVLAIPDHWQLVRASVEGHPALVEPVGDRRWRLQLTSDHLPQMIEAVSRCPQGAGPAGDGVRLARPTLLTGDRPIPVELSLWSLCGPPAQALLNVDRAKLATGHQYATWRLERLVGVAEGALPAVAQLSALATVDWLRPWAGVLAAAERDAATARQDVTGQIAIVQVSPSTDEQLATATARARAWLQVANDVLSQHAARSLPTGQSETEIGVPSGDRWTYCVADGGIDHLTIGAASAGISPGESRLIGILVIIGLATMLAWLVRLPAAHDLLWRWPHTAGLLFGLAVWACLRPGWLGLSIVVVVVLLVVRPAWPGPTFRADESTVLQRGPAP